jgi:LCP family protein required for cell wall assembly
MSDGDNATPGPPDAASGADKPGVEGNHTDAVTVADLIAKLAADRPAGERTSRRRAEAEAREIPHAPAPEIATEITDRFEAMILEPGSFEHEGRRQPVEPVTEAMRAYAAEVPVQAAAARPSRPVPTSYPARAHPAPARHHTARSVGRVAAALIATFALVLTGGAWQWQSMKNNSLNRVSALDPHSRDIVDATAQFGDENFLIVGTDSRIGQNSAIGAGTTDDAAGARSDTIMLVNIPADRKRVVAVSFPRDLAITPIKCEPWNPETGAYGPITDEESPMYGMDEAWTETKLNSAYAVGGPKCLVKVIQRLSGLSVNRFMAVDFTGFAKMVDALGGVEVCTTTPLQDYELGTVLAKAGRQTVDGHTALNYVRARQVTTEVNGDYGRIKRQQLFLSSLLRSLISKEVFFSLSKLNNGVYMFSDDSYGDNSRTKDLVDLGQSVQGVSAGRITFVTVPTTGYADDWGNEQPRLHDMGSLFDAIINDDPLPEERKERLQSPEERERFDETTKCILCAACTTACPPFWATGEYIGPAAIVNAHRFIFDSRDQGAAQRLAVLNDRMGVWACRTAFNCTEACPREIKITEAIAEVKGAIVTGKLK